MGVSVVRRTLLVLATIAQLGVAIAMIVFIRRLSDVGMNTETQKVEEMSCSLNAGTKSDPTGVAATWKTSHSAFSHTVALHSLYWLCLFCQYCWYASHCGVLVPLRKQSSPHLHYVSCAHTPFTLRSASTMH